MRLLPLCFLACLSISAFAQEPIVSPIETFPVNASLIAPLEGSSDRGIIRVDRIEPNPYHIEVGDTLLVSFYFGLKKLANEKDLVGIKKGDKFSARMAARQNRLDGAYYYQVFHYKNISYLKDRAAREARLNDESQN